MKTDKRTGLFEVLYLPVSLAIVGPFFLHLPLLLLFIVFSLVLGIYLWWVN